MKDPTSRTCDRPLFTRLLFSGALLYLSACGQSPATKDDRTDARAATGPVAETVAQKTVAALTETTLPAPALAAWERHARSECRDADSRFSAVRLVPIQSITPEQEADATMGAFFTGEFNGDGRPDFVVATENWGCAGASDHGKMGPPKDFIVSTADGYQAAYGFNGWIGPQDIKRRGQRDIIEYRRGWNGNCGPIGVAVWGWAGKQMDVIEWRDDKGKSVDKEGCPLTSRAAATGDGKLAVKNGLWADDRTGGCAGMQTNDPAFILNDNKMLFVQDYKNLRPVKDLGAGRFQTGSRDNGDQLKLHILSPTRMRIEEGMTGSYSWCSPKTRWEPWEFDPSEG
ncbi:hypothetical protein [Sphingopyxis sp.]|uniref:hypothetical protein n=1 Tax=Sphingopyxis sp. TaxID=1908224 RepID=UPI003D0B1783